MSQHTGLPVEGYRPQSDASVDLVNANKQLEEQCLRVLDDLAMRPGIDKEWLAAGREQLQVAWMSINRSVFRPGRARLPGDPP